MIININGRQLGDRQEPRIGGWKETSEFPSYCLTRREIIWKEIKEMSPPPYALIFLAASIILQATPVLAAGAVPASAYASSIPTGVTGPARKLWFLIDRVQDFALPVGIVMGLWGLIRYIMGDPAGKQQIWQALLGFIGLFVIPEVFLAVWEAFRG